MIITTKFSVNDTVMFKDEYYTWGKPCNTCLTIKEIVICITENTMSETYYFLEIPSTGKANELLLIGKNYE